MTYIQMRATFIALLVVCMGVTSLAQLQPPPIDWERTYGGSDGEGLLDFDKAYDSGYIFLSNAQSTDGDLINSPGNVMWIVKLDNNGNIEWQKKLAPAYSGGVCLNKAYDSCYIISRGSVLKISKNGDSLWQRSYPLRGVNYITSTSDSCFIACGYKTVADKNIWVAKLDSIGNVLWEYTIDNPDYDEAFTAIEGHNKEILVSGVWTQVSAYQERISFKLDSLGNFIKYLPVAFDVIQKTFDGNFITARGSQTTDLLDKADTIKLQIPVFSNWVEQTSDSGFISGATFGLQTFSPLDLLVTKLKPDGTVAWSKQFGGSNADYMGAVMQTNDSGYIAAGITRSSDGDISSNHGDWDVWVVKLGKPFYVPPPTNATTVSKGKNILAYPTITKDNVYIILPKDTTATSVTLLNYSGQTIAAPVSGYKNEYAIDLHTIAAGNYLLQVTYHSVTETIKVIRQ